MSGCGPHEEAAIGYGDDLIASGLARGAAARGKRIAFGDGRRIVWRAQSYEIFRGNPNVARPGDEHAPDVDWIPFYKGHRFYGDFDGKRWHFKDFRCPPGEIFFSDEERRQCEDYVSSNLVIIEPAVKAHGACVGANKQWPVDRYLTVASALRSEGYNPICLGEERGHRGWPMLPHKVTNTFREALTVLSTAKLYIGPEGGLHHASAALGIPAVVIFGGFNTPRSTGYSWHTNLTAPGEPCGNVEECKHCRDAMNAISVLDVVSAAMNQLTAEGKRRAV